MKTDLRVNSRHGVDILNSIYYTQGHHLWKTFENENSLVCLLKIQNKKRCHYEGNVKVRCPIFSLHLTRSRINYYLSKQRENKLEGQTRRITPI